MARLFPVVAASLSSAAVLSAPAPAAAEEVNLDLVLSPATASVNTIELGIEAFGFGDTSSSTVSGNALANVDVDFLADGSVGMVNDISFAGGDVAFDQTVNFFIDLSILGSVSATGTGLGGELDTPGAATAVDNAGDFDLAGHQLTVNQGELNVVGTGAAAPVTTSMDFGLAPIPATLVGTGNLSVTLDSVVGNLATYTATLTAPVNFSEPFDAGGVTVNVSANGNLLAVDVFTRLLGVEGDIDGDGDVDIDDLGILAGNWQQSISGVENGDIDGDGDVDIDDLGILAGNWQVGVEEGGQPGFDQAVADAGIAIPEPGSLALLALGTLALTRRRR